MSEVSEAEAAPAAEDGPRQSDGARNREVVDALRERWPDAVKTVSDNRGQWCFDVDREHAFEMAKFLKEDPKFAFVFLVDVTGLDHYGEEPRFRAVYVLRSFERNEDIVLKCAAPEEDIWVPSMVPLWNSANALEREAYDMFGLEFRGHPRLERIMMPEIFTDFPLRKDFPMEGTMSDREWAEWIIGRAQRRVGDGT